MIESQLRAGVEPELATLEQVGLLLGDADAPTSIRALLERAGFTPRILAGEPVGLEEESQGSMVAVVLWAADPARACDHEIELLSERFAGTPIVLACERIERREVRAALSAGVAGVVLADELDSGLAACVHAVSGGQLCVPRRHWREVEPSVLSMRERQILGLVAMGYMNRQIADRLYLAESTVKSHLSSAFGKLEVHSRAEAVELILGRERGLTVGAAGFLEEPTDCGCEAG